MEVNLAATELTNLVQIGEHELMLDDLELCELACNVLSHLQLEKPIIAQHPSARTLLQMCYSMMSDYLRQPAELACVGDQAHGIIWACANKLSGRIEFRLIDLDQFHEVTGSRIYATEPEVAASWLKGMLSASASKLPFDSLIELREGLQAAINSRINGDRLIAEANSFLMSAFSALAARNRAPALQCQIAAFEDDDLDRLERFCDQHKQLGLLPAQMLKVGIEVANLKVAASNVVLKLANDLLGALNAQSFAAVNARAYHDGYAEPPTRKTLNSIRNKSIGLFAAALGTIEGQLKSNLMSATLLNLRMANVDNDHSAQQMVELVLAVAQGQLDTQSMFTLDDEAIKNLRFCADQWWRLLLVETMRDNGLLAVVTSGKDAGRARQFDGTQKYWFPIRQRQLR